MIVLDTGIIVAAADRRDRNHKKAKRFFEATTEPLAMSPLVLAEVDYLLTKLLGARSALALHRSVEVGDITVERFTNADVGDAIRVIERYPDLNITDASTVVVAARLQTRRVATLDHQHFGALRAADGRAFDLLPR